MLTARGGKHGPSQKPGSSFCRLLPGRSTIALLCFCSIAVPWFLVVLLGAEHHTAVYIGGSRPRGCISWRATKSCHPFGERDSAGDKTCATVIRKGSGYCECDGGVTAARVSCGTHRFSCKRKCQELGYDQGALISLPTPFACEQPAPYDPAKYLPEAAAQPLVGPKDTDDLARAAGVLWDRLEQLLTRYGVEGIKVPSVRTGRQDWVAEGKHMRRKDVEVVGARVAGFLSNLPPYPEDMYEGRGVAIVGGGLKYIVPVWVNIHMLRLSGCRLPIEVWFPVDEFPGQPLEASLKRMGATCRRLDFRNLDLRQKYAIKAVVLLLTRFREVLFLDADNIAVEDPSSLFELEQYRSTGALFWQDYWENTAAEEVRGALQLAPTVALPAGSFESGQILIDKQRHWRGLLLAVHLNCHSRLFYELLSCYLGKGDKETFAYALLATNETFHTVPQPPGSIGLTRRACQPPGLHCHYDFFGNTMLQPHPTTGRPLFLHANMDKWTLRLPTSLADYHRRWVLLRPGNIDWPAWASDTFGYDVEAEVYSLLKQLRCQGWWDGYLKMRHKMGDRPAAPLSGFHSIPPGMDFRRMYRKGYVGNFLQLFKPTLADVWSHLYRRHFRLSLLHLRNLLF